MTGFLQTITSNYSFTQLFAIYEAGDGKEDKAFLLSLYTGFQGRGRETC